MTSADGRAVLLSDSELLDQFSEVLSLELDAEMATLCTSFRKPLATYHHDEFLEFDWEDVKRHFTSTKAPRLTGLFQRLCNLDPEFIPSGPDVDDVRNYDEADPLDDSDDTSDSETEEDTIPRKPKPITSRTDSKHLMITIATAILCYSRTRSANLVQGFLGYFLTSCRVKKRCLATFNKLGLSVSYQSTLRIIKCVADAIQGKMAVLVNGMLLRR